MRLIDADQFEVYSTNGSAYEGDSFFAYMDGAQKVLEDIDAAPTIDPKNVITEQWISVKDKLPPQGEEVLAYVPLDGQIFVGHCSKYYWKDQYVWYITTAMKVTKTMTKKVSHWMHLPGAPKSETKK